MANIIFSFFSRFYLEELELQKHFLLINFEMKSYFLDNARVVPFNKQYVFVQEYACYIMNWIIKYHQDL